MWKCNRCGTENDDSYDYCIVCGVERNAPPPTNMEPSNPAQNTQTSIQQTPMQAPAPSNQGQSQNTQPNEPQVASVNPPTAAPPTPASRILKLAIIQSPNPELVGRTIDLDMSIFSIISIGRNPENFLQFPDPSISRRHALIEIRNDKLYVKDLKSTNGTYVFQNGYFEKIDDDKEISTGDILKFGEGTVVRIIA